MFRLPRKALEKWFDSVTDGWNPIVVRELRRAVRSGLLFAFTVYHFGLLLLGHIVDWNDPTTAIFWRTLPTVGSMLLMGFVGGDRCLCHVDELIGTVPLTPTQHFYGHLGTSCILSAFFLVQALPFLAFSSSVLLRLGILLGGFAIAQAGTLFCFTFTIRSQTIVEVSTIGLTTSLVCLPMVGLPFATVLFFWHVYLSPLPQDVLTSWLLAAVVSVGGTLALLSFAYLAYRLSLYHFANRFKNPWQAVSVNMGIYLLWSCFWSVVAFAVVLRFSG